jgi:epoxide hydrolase-like predicted phosphatase
MIQAIIFDWGGVLIENPTPAMIQYFSTALGVDDRAINHAGDHLVLSFQKGSISEDTLWEEMCRLLKVQKPSSPSLWYDAFKKSYRPRAEMFSLATRLKSIGFRVGLLSNAEIPTMKFFKEQHYDMFEATIFSCAVGVSKPERRIYEITLDELQVLPYQSIFIDDREDFIDGAKKIGIQTIHFKSPSQVKAELSRLLKKS